ncbi:catalase [Streptomyces sp. NPDC056529]|uniref:catalase n=1 Tax=Streptomyces sp. NPDC056529 TaxID=3345855 RepID=UPI00368D4010
MRDDERQTAITEFRPATTTDSGAPVESDEHSLMAGPGGPVLLQDAYLIEQMAQFNRERIPERQPHAKGSGAFGHFEVTHDVSQYTKAALFQPGTRTDMVARFPTVAGERGSPDTIRDGDFPSWTLHVQVMPYEDAATYRFNPFDLTKVWPHGDYPLIPVGRMTLDRNPTDNHAEIAQAAFRPNNFVPGIGPSPDRMLLGRLFSYADAHRARIGTNYQQLPVNAPVVDVHTYSKDGATAYRKTSDPVYAPNSKGGPAADTERYGSPPSRAVDGEITRTAYVSHPEDDDWGQPGTLVREVLDDAARDRLVDNVVGHLLDGVSEPVLERAFAYWTNIDPAPGDRSR